MQHYQKSQYISLDNDPDFINCTNNKKCNIDIDFYLQKLYETSCCKYLHNYSKFYVCREFIHNRKSFLRIELPDNNAETINETIAKVSKLSIKYLCGNNLIYIINLQLNLILMHMYNIDITIIDVEQIMSMYSDNELKNLMHKYDNGMHIFSSKFMFRNSKGFYLDIPLFEEFYNYSRGTPTISLDPPNYTIAESDYTLNKISICFEECIVGENKTNEYDVDLSCHSHIGSYILPKQYLILDTEIHNLYITNHNIMMYRTIPKCKFIFFIIENKSNILPQLNNITLNKYCTNMVQIPLDNIVTYYQNSKIIYGISTNKDCDMKNWTSIKTENLDHNNIYYTTFCTFSIALLFDEINEPLTVTTIAVTQKIQLFNGGTTSIK
jgi:hypothetical protein